MISRQQKIAVIGLSTLEAFGLRELIHQIANFKVERISSIERAIEDGDSYVAFIASAEVFVSALDFFMPRRHKVLIVNNENSQTGNSSPGSIGKLTDEIEIKERIEELLANAGETNDEKGELSSREIEVLRLVAKGKINKEIADQLCISVNTVITHRKNLSSKLGVKSASALTTYALMNGLL